MVLQKILKNLKEIIWDHGTEQQSLGYNFRMNDVQTSLGLSQLNRINEC